MNLSLTTRAEGERAIVEVGGEIDSYTAPRLSDALQELVEDGNRHLVVDLERVEFLDSTGLKALIKTLRLVTEQDGSMALVCTKERLLKVFRITGVDAVFQIHPDVASAL